MRRLRTPWLVLPLCLCLLVLLPWADGVAQETTAGLQGYIKDQTGAVIPSATVEVGSPALLAPRQTQTDQFGYYRFTELPPGFYTLRVSSPGFRTFRQSGIELLVGRLPAVDVTLQVGAVAETVEVSGAVPLVDPTTSKVAINIPAEIIEGLPKGREFFSLINFAPGARQEPLQSVNQGNTGFQVDGASDGENTYLIEGMDTTDVRQGGLGLIDLTYNTDFVQEIQIKSSGSEAEYGGSLGGVINVVQKRGGNEWHGTVFTYYRGDALDASRYPSLRYDPLTSASWEERTSELPEYYQARPDDWRRLEAGFTAGGYLLKNRLWLFTGYDPILSRLRRTVNFQNQRDPANDGPRTFSRDETTHNWQTRLDANLGSKVHLYASWVYAYNRATGTSLPGPDSPYGQFNESSVTDVTSYNPKRGHVRPDSLWKVGGDWQLTPRLIITAWYGYWFSNYHDVGAPSGLQYRYGTSAVGRLGLDGTPVPPAFALPSGYSNIPGSNFATRYDAFTRSSMRYDVSYLRPAWGRHSLKFGYGNHRLSNDLHNGYDPALVNLVFGYNYWPHGPVGAANCAQVEAANDAQGLPPVCMGNYGYYTIRELGEHGKVHSYSHSFYAQDAWTIGHGLTLNFGLRLEKEYLPPYAPGAPALGFGLGDKIAPRLGGAWDVLRNGKWKVYASYGKFFDVMKYELPRLYFGGSYHRECTYTLDSPDFTQILPTPVAGRYCPGGGTRPGTLLENLDWRMIVKDPQNPLADPHIKPMQQHEFVVGSDYALTSNLGLAVRYVRKRLDYAVEDSAVDVGVGTVYFLGNPGYGMLRDLWQRPVTDSSVVPPLTYPATCPDCPYGPKASRRYDGLEVRLQKRYGRGWFGQLSYTYSRLYGNYSGLTSTFSYDDVTSVELGGGGGRHSPNITGAFDLLSMQFTAQGKPLDGPLPTDRPHTLKLFGFYTLKWRGQESTLGLAQVVYSGTPVSTVWPTPDGGFPQFVEGLGNWVSVHRDPTAGDLVKDGIVKGYRTPAFTQTDLQLAHQFKLSKTRENLRFGVSFNVLNLFNQHARMGFVESPVSYGVVSPVDAEGWIDWLALTRTGWDYTSLTNEQWGTVNALYGMPSLFQPSRSAYLRVQFSF